MHNVFHLPLVSVIVPTYNRPELLPRALESIEAQEFTNYEVLVVNDGGADVRDIVSCFSKAAYLRHDENRGLPAARNTALAHARGKYVAYLDDDDWYYPEHLRLLVGALQGGARAAYTDAQLTEIPGKFRPYMSIEFSWERLKRGNIFPVCCVMHERALIDEVGGFDESLPTHEDWDLWIRIGAVTPFAHIPQMTCVVDLTRTTMMKNGAAMTAGYLTVRQRYGG